MDCSSPLSPDSDDKRECTNFTPEYDIYNGQYENVNRKNENEPVVGQKRCFRMADLHDNSELEESQKHGKQAKMTRPIDDLEALLDSDFEEEEDLLANLPAFGLTPMQRTPASIYMNIRNKCLYI